MTLLRRFMTIGGARLPWQNSTVVDRRYNHMSAFFEALGRPEYVHVLLNPLPVYGLGAGVLGLVIALIARQGAAVRVSLAVVALTAASAWPVLLLGEAAYEGTRVTLDDDGQKWLDVHQERAQRAVWVFYGAAALAVAALVLPLHWPRALVPLALLTLLAALGALVAGGWISYAGGRVRHREFRTEAPP
jgi:hypothetical protein